MNEKKNSKVASTLKRIIGIVIIPLLCFVATEIACLANGTSLFSGGYSTFQIFMRGITFVLLLSFGVSINMHTGRFDFATGAVMLVGGVLGAKLAVAWGVGPIGMMAIAGFFGALFGAICGGLYVLLKLPPMIIGLGMTLIIEGLVAIFTDGCKPVNFGSDSSFFVFAQTPVACITICLLALIMMVVLFHYTKFGYDYRALQTGQKISVNTGVNEKKNAFVCYTIAGLLFGVAGAISICSSNGITPTINFSTIATMFSCFLPLFFSGLISRYCNKQVAILIACIAYEFIQVGFGSIQFVNAGFTPSVKSIIEAIILVGFLIYQNNEHTFVEIATLKKLREKIKAKKQIKEPVQEEV